MLSDAAQSVWAKTSPRDDGWLPLTRHLEDAAAVAGLLWDRWLPASTRRQISAPLPGGDGDGRRLVTGLAGVHDLGKATPAFAVQAEAMASHLTARMRDAGLAMPTKLADRSTVRHELAGQHLLTRWLTDGGWSRKAACTYAVAVGGHHGAPPDTTALQRVPERPHLVTPDERWAAVQTELLEHAAAMTSVTARLPAWSSAPLPSPVQVLLGAVVIVADWIASDDELFAYYPVAAPASSAERAEAAWRTLDLPPQWRPCAPPEGDEQLFADRFSLPPGAALHPVQRAAAALAREVDEPGLVVVEAPMGAGKTEAALAAAEVLAHRTGAGGVFVALPTMATSDAMFTRVRRWVERLPAASGAGDQGDLTVFLAHGKAALNPEADALRRTRGPAAVAQDEDTARRAGDPQRAVADQRAVAIAHAWLRGRKRGPLSSIVVGTVDQVLFAGLRSKHLVLRHLALASKVVVVDEVHAVDVYMGRYFQRVLHWLGAHGVPTVVLSATLPSAQRRALVAAYDDGRARARGLPAPDESAYAVLDGDIGYPVVTASTGGAPRVVVTEQGGRSQQVSLERLDDGDAALVAALRGALAGGGVAAVVRNTVGRAQSTYELLREELDAEVVLLHSRFVAVDRAARERELRERLGPPAVVAAAGRERPQRLVVVGTQVIEQSLDIDVDLMVTDLAPVDLVLQRLGRLHRHRRGDGESERPPLLRAARALVAGVADWSGDPPEAVRGSVSVYRRAPLLRALAVLGPVLDRGHVGLPGDIAPLVQAAYAEDLAPPPGWAEAFTAAEDDRRRHDATQQERAAGYLLGPVKKPGESIVGWVAGSAGEADDSARGQAQVRDSDESVEVVVVQRVGDEVRLLPWLDGLGGRVVPTEGRPEDAVARVAATCTLRLPVQLSNPAVIDAVLTALERRWYPGWQDSHWLSGQLVLELDEQLSAVLAGHRVVYDRDRGLLVTTEEERA